MELFAPGHLLIILLIVVILFGGRKIPELMRGLGEGVRNFREGMQGTPQQNPPQNPPQQQQPPQQNPPAQQ
ncbi:MAG TPA: twin-arginine translocase TatA/TatE family subunit [Candidatus Acidoferrales bacterium]|nr:twin-arginine translocase TatA/TatE family subunit [Candidatus Acidoferrales bacterium]